MLLLKLYFVEYLINPIVTVKKPQYHINDNFIPSFIIYIFDNSVLELEKKGRRRKGKEEKDAIRTMEE